MKKLTIVGDEKILKMIQKENQIRFRKFNMVSCIEEVQGNENVVDFTDEEKEVLRIEAERSYENLQKKVKHKK